MKSELEKRVEALEEAEMPEAVPVALGLVPVIERPGEMRPDRPGVIVLRPISPLGKVSLAGRWGAASERRTPDDWPT